MRGLSFSALASVALVSSAYAAPEQFDLKCTGNAEIVRGSQSAKGSAQLAFRVDLSSKRYCLDECSVIRPIPSFDADKIVFMSARLYPESRGTTVNRVNGTIFAENFKNTMDVSRFAGTCIAAPFSGFPAHKF